MSSLAPYIFNFVAFTLLVALINLLIHQIKNHINRKRHPDQLYFRDDGLITDFKTGKTEVQKGTKFTY